jgi:hypothetical protein
MGKDLYFAIQAIRVLPSALALGRSWFLRMIAGCLSYFPYFNICK